MKRLCQLLLVLLTSLQLCGGAQGLMQCVAWAGMLASYAPEAGVAGAVAMTFDGEHPCALCHAIADAKEQEHQAPKESPAPDGLKLCKEMVLFCIAEAPRPLTEEPVCRTVPEPLPGRGLMGGAPLLPPPERAEA